MSQRYIYRNMNTWDEKNYIEQKTNCLNNSDNAPSGSTNEIRSDSTMSAWNATGSQSQMYKLCYNGETGEYLGDNKSHVVYLWTETRDGMEYPCYVGQTTKKIHKRCHQHLFTYKERLFQRKLRTRRINFKCYAVEFGDSIEKLNTLETLYIKHFNTFIDNNPLGYNLTEGGDNHAHSQVTKEKISISRRGSKHHFYGKHLSDDHKNKQSIALKGKPRPTFSDQWKKNIKAAKQGDKHPFFGKHLTSEHKEKLSVGKMGKNNPMFGKIVADEIRIKISTNSPVASSGFRGVSYDKNAKKYQARIKLNGKWKYIGMYKTALEANNARESYIKKHHE